MSERWNEMDDIDLLQLEAEMGDELRAVREAATVYAERAWARGETVVFEQPSAGHRWSRWAAAGVATAALVVGSLQIAHHRGSEHAEDAPVVKVRAASPVSDEALLDQIQSDLSSGVPAAMEPLQASDTQSARSAVRR